MNVWRVGIAALVVTIVGSGSMRAQERETGVITGRVVDTSRSMALPGALVRVEGTPLVAATDRSGAFRIVSVPAGKQTLAVSYLGRPERTVETTVVAGETKDVAVSLDNAAVSESVTVVGELTTDADARALNQQRTALNITNVVSADQIGSFPDPNAAEAASRIPGVSITRDQGEGRYILVRGTEARLNSVMIDGERIPSPEDARQVMLDVVPADQLQSIQVSKAITPDMDADSIGGAVNLITKQATGRMMGLFSLGGGYNALQKDSGQRSFSGTVGRRVMGNRVGLLAGFSASSLNRGSEDFEPQYDAGNLSDLQLRDYQIKRERYGVNVTADARVGNNSSFSLKTIYNKFKDYEVNNRIRFRPPNRRIEHVLKNRHQSDTVQSVAFNGAQVLPNRATVEYKVAWAKAFEEQPDRLDTIFRQTNINFSPNVSASSIDPDNIQPNPSANNPANARLNVWETEIFKAVERDVTASVDLHMPLTTGGSRVSFLKAGFKVKDKAKRRDFEVEIGTPTSPVMFPQLEDPSFENSRFLDFLPAGYASFPGINPTASRALFNALPASARAFDRGADAGAYRANETVGAAYAMLELYFGPKVVLVPGFRYEMTRVDYTGNEVIFDEDGDYASTNPVGGKRNTGVFLPGLHLRYSVSDATNVRAAYSRTLARPNYYDLVPYQLVLQEDGDIERGNPALTPTVSDNLDLLVEHYFQSVGVISGGVFVKRLHDYIFPFRFSEVNFGDPFNVTQPQNGESASLRGVELAFQNQLRFLPGPFNGIGVYANYTMTDSSARFPDRTEDSTLPGQSRHLGNFALSFETRGFSAKAAWNFHGRYIDAVGPSAEEDVYYDNHTQVDVNFGQRITKNLRVYADFLNLTNAPLRYYMGTTDRPIQQEYTRWWSSFGVRANW